MAAGKHRQPNARERLRLVELEWVMRELGEHHGGGCQKLCVRPSPSQA